MLDMCVLIAFITDGADLDHYQHKQVVPGHQAGQLPA